MKSNNKLILRGLFAIFLVFTVLTCPAKTNAAAVAGALEITQWFNNFAIGADVSVNAAGAASEALGVTKEFGLDIVANQMQAQFIKNIQDSTILWAKSGFYGQPSYIQNPSGYFKNLQNNVIRLQLSAISVNTGDPATDRIIKDVIVNQRLDQRAIEAKLRSDLSTAVKGEVCSDSTLSDIARKDVSQGLGVTTQAQIVQQKLEDAVSARKAELWSKLCGGQSSGNLGASQFTGAGTRQATPAQSQLASNRALEDQFTNNFAAGGWNAWLALANPKNTVEGKRVLANELITQKVDKEVALKKEELQQGQGSQSQKVCANYATTDINGIAITDEEMQANPNRYCTEWRQTGTAQETSLRVSKADNSTVERLANTQGFNAIFAAFVSGAIARLTSEAMDVFSDKDKGFALNTGSTQTLDEVLGDGGNNTAITQGGTSNDLASNADAKNKAISGMLKSLDTDMQQVESISITTSDVMLTLKKYEVLFNSLKQCDELASSLPTYPEQEPGANIHSQYMMRSREFLPAVAKFSELEKNIPAYKAYIDEYASKIKSSNSTEEVNDLYGKYEQAKLDGALPKAGNDIILQTEAERIKNRINQDMNMKTAGGQEVDQFGNMSINTLLTKCSEQTCVKWFQTLGGSKSCTQYMTPGQNVTPVTEYEQPVGGA